VPFGSSVLPTKLYCLWSTFLRVSKPRNAHLLFVNSGVVNESTGAMNVMEILNLSRLEHDKASPLLLSSILHIKGSAKTTENNYVQNRLTKSCQPKLPISTTRVAYFSLSDNKIGKLM
jgi:hypothetical protein